MKCQQILLKQDSLENELSKVNSQIQSQCEALIHYSNPPNSSNFAVTTPPRVATGSKRPTAEPSIPEPTTPALPLSQAGQQI